MDSTGSIVYDARIDTRQLANDAKSVQAQINSVGDSTEKAATRGEQSWQKMGVAMGLVAGVAQTVVGKAIGVVESAIGGAVKRVDTLDNATRVFANMGFKAQDSSKAMDNLKKSVEGLPTSMDEAVTGMEQLVSSTGNLDTGQKLFSALNNAVLGFGGTSAQVNGAVLQFGQALSAGKVDAQTFNSMLQNNLGPVLNAIAKDMGLTTKQLKEGLSDGSIGIDSFNKALIKLNEQGGGGLASLDKISHDATSGIGTGFANMQTSVVKGLASIIKAFGSTNISSAISAIGTGFKFVLDTIAGIIVFVIGAGTAFGTWISQNIGLVTQLGTVIGVLLIPQLIKTAVSGAVALAGYITGLATATAATVASSIRMAGSWLFALGPIGLIVAAIVAVAALIIFNWDTVSKFMAGVFAGIGQAGLGAWNFIMGVFSGVVGFFAGQFSGAFGAIVGVFGGLTGFFRGVWAGIVGIFGSVGVSIGNAIGGAFKGIINGIISGAIGIINGFINAINGAIDLVNKVPGVHIGKLGTLSAPRLASGGIVTSATLATIGEGSEPEAVIPLSKLDDMLHHPNVGDGSAGGGGQATTVINVNLSGIMARSRADTRKVAADLVESINEALRASGKAEIGGGAVRSLAA